MRLEKKIYNVKERIIKKKSTLIYVLQLNLMNLADAYAVEPASKTPDIILLWDSTFLLRKQNVSRLIPVALINKNFSKKKEGKYETSAILWSYL